MDDFTPHVWETTDYGQSWRDLSQDLPEDDYAKVIRQHPANPNLLFLGMDRGLFASLDRGLSWVDIRNNLPRASVRGIKIQSQYNDLVIGTHGTRKGVVQMYRKWLASSNLFKHLDEIRGKDLLCHCGPRLRASSAARLTRFRSPLSTVGA